jgi:CheY-like chemotaxis protein
MRPGLPTKMMPRVLIVDDDLDIRSSLREILVEEGFDVDVAEDGKRALEKLEDGFQPCLVLLDLMMPRMNGLEFLEERKSHPTLAGLPVVVMTAGKTVVDGVSAVLRKPMKLDTLLMAVGEHCVKNCA